ncbi:MAG: recombinase family protein [Alphaproteobacteria bacterium]|nr:recombinase family protein [Alphaproteobacteria bacterium]
MRPGDPPSGARRSARARVARYAAPHTAHFERRLIAERTKDGIAAARARGRRPGRQPLDADNIAAALSLVKAGLSPTAVAKQLGLGRSTVYREIGRAGIERAV